MKNSRAKGANGEREAAKLLQAHGFDARRGQQYCGANGDADVVGLPGAHIEVKRTERFELYKAMEQAESDARPGELPVVLHRKNRAKWVAVLDAEEFIELYKAAKGL